MKKTISLLSVFSLILTMLFLFAGCSNEKIDQSKEVVRKYYDSFSSGDAKDIISLFGSSFTESLGGEEDAETIIGSRIAVLGEDMDYNIYGTSYSKDNGNVLVVIEVEAKYGRDGESYDEKFQLEDIDGQMLITQVSMEDEKAPDIIYGDFFTLYNEADQEKFLSLFADAFFAHAPESRLLTVMDNYNLALGKIIDYEQLEQYVYCETLPEDNIVVVQETTFSVQFEGGRATITLQLCNEDGNIKINYFYGYPDLAEHTADAFFNYMNAADFEGAADMYHDVFYKYFDGGRAGWLEILQAISGYGKYAGYEILNWEYFETELDDGAVFTGITALVNAQFGNTIFYNEITISLEPENQKIIGHNIEISD